MTQKPETSTGPRADHYLILMVILKPMIQFKRYSSRVCLLLIVYFFLVACSSTTAPPPEAEATLLEDDPIVLRIGDLSYPESQLSRELAFDRAIALITTGRELTRQDPAEKLERLATTLLIDQQAIAANISVSEQEITQALEAFIEERNSSREAFEAALRGQGYTLADFRENVARTVRIERYLAEIVLAEAETPTQQQEQLVAWLREIQSSVNIEVLYEPPEAAPSVGFVAPDFTLTNLAGEKVTLSQFRGRPVVVNFWATWCVPCRQEMPAFQRAFSTYQDEGLVILALNLEETAPLVEPFVEEFGLTFEILYDNDGAINKTYQVTGLPRTVFIDRQGVIKHIQVGEVQEVVLQGLLDRIL